MTEKMPLIKFEKVKKIFKSKAGEFTALNGIDFSVERGEFISIMGHSGSGKSTTMNIIGGMDTLTEGSYLFNGEHIEDYDNKKLANFRNELIGFVFQSFNLLKRYSVIDNILLPTQYSKKPQVDFEERAMSILETVGIVDKADSMISELSGGQMQRVAIARALIGEPEIILADEPTGNLDSATAHSIMDLFVKLNKENKTIILVTHEDDIAAYSKRKIVLKDGLIINDVTSR